MTKADIVKAISEKYGIQSNVVKAVINDFTEIVKESLSEGEPVYLRHFGSFIVKERAQKTARNIKAQTTITIPAHKIPAFKPAKEFMQDLKK